MNHRTARWITMFVALLPCSIASYAFSGGPPTGLTGAPGEGTCDPMPRDRQLQYRGRQHQAEPRELHRRHEAANRRHDFGSHAIRWGFQATSRLADNTPAEQCESVDGNTQVRIAGRVSVHHAHSRGNQGGNTRDRSSFEFDWTAPASGEVDLLHRCERSQQQQHSGRRRPHLRGFVQADAGRSRKCACACRNGSGEERRQLRLRACRPAPGSACSERNLSVEHAHLAR